VKSRIHKLARHAVRGDAVAHLVTLAFASLVLLVTVLLVVELYQSSALSCAAWMAVFVDVQLDPVLEIWRAAVITGRQ
jgi:hypothetical protein